MKKYSFRLEAVLKLKKLKEENCRSELGQMIMQMQKIENQIEQNKLEIKKYFEIQENSLSSGVQANQIQAFPILIKGKELNITILDQDKIRHEKLIADKKIELAKLRGDVKIFENMKQKDFDEFRKAYNKEMDQKVEEQTRNWLNFKEDEA
jgi:flagellar export protein FliJ